MANNISYVKLNNIPISEKFQLKFQPQFDF